MLDKKLVYKGIEVTLYKCSYPNGRIALQLMYMDKEVGGELPFATCTVNIPEYDMPEGYVAIKDWSENGGMLAWMQDNDLIGKIEDVVKCGYTVASICKFLKSAK